MRPTNVFTHMYRTSILENLQDISNALDLISVSTPYLLADAGVNPRFFNNSWDYVFTTEPVSGEANSNLGRHLPGLLDTYTYRDFKENDGFMTVTGMLDDMTGNYDVESISMTTFNDTLMTTATGEFLVCPHCGNSTIVKLTNTSGQSVYLCNSVVSSTGDFSLAVQAIAFPEKLTLVTEEGCLGSAFYSFSSFSPTKGFFGGVIFKAR